MRSRGRQKSGRGRADADSGRQVPRTVRLALSAAGLLALALVGGCDWLLLFDVTPPTCSIAAPADSGQVNGTVLIQATAFDSSGVERVQFYVDDGLVAVDSSSPYTGSWNAAGLPERSWHRLYCIAYDPAQNKGYSDTISVEIAGVGQQSVFHGELEVAAGTYREVEFSAGSGDTLAGDMLITTGGTLSSFLWLDQANYQLFAASQPYSALFQKDDFSQLNLRQVVPAAGKYHLVFSNRGSGARTCWARFVLE
jgi:hypothetical protein